MLAFMLTVLCSCSDIVSYIRFPSEEDSERYTEIFEVPEKTGEESVIFYSDEELYGIEVFEAEYDSESGEYRKLNTLWHTDTLSKGSGIKIFLDLSREIPYTAVKYTRQNGQTREQYIYKNPKTDKLWLLEQSN